MRSLLILWAVCLCTLVGHSAQANIFWSQIGGKWIESHLPLVEEGDPGDLDNPNNQDKDSLIEAVRDDQAYERLEETEEALTE